MIRTARLRRPIATPLVVSPRAVRLAQFAIASLLIAWIAFVVWSIHDGFSMDYGVYRQVGQRVLSGGPLYQPYQLAGPYSVVGGWQGDNMYPPTSAPLFVAFAALPAPLAMFLWYLVPLGVVAAVLVRSRPSGWRLVACLALLAYPPSIGVVYLGNPALWVLAALSLGTLYRWPAAFVLLKPSLAPFALLGLRDRRWWIVAAGFAAVAVALLPLTLEYAKVLLNARGQFSGLLYSLPNVPIMLIPLVADMKRPARAEARAGGELVKSATS
jgi:hypothetical protein